MAPASDEPHLFDELLRPLSRYKDPPAPPYALPPGTHVAVLSDAGAAEAALQAFARAAPGEPLGLDTEWADPSSSVALLQIASRSGGCLILRMPRLGRVPTGLQELLLDKDRLKCGVAVAQDLKLLERQFGLSSRGFVDLQPVALHHGLTGHGMGLAAICRSVLGATMNKSKDIRQSDWSGELSQEQVDYAACDAFVAVEILEEMHRRCAAPDQGVQEWCSEFVDRVPKGLRNESTRGRLGSTNRVSKKVVHAPQRKTALYGGCKLLSPNGLHLANVSSAKALWYVAQGLGERVDDDGDETGQLVVRLTFEPKGVGHAGDDFYLQKMENRCVGCGSDQDLVRFSIVPHVFRCQLPRRFKEHSSHDIVLLCHTCFVAASNASQELRRRHLRGCGLTQASSPGAVSPFMTDQAKLHARGAAVALRHPGLPDHVRKEKEAIVCRFLAKEEGHVLSEEELESVRNMSTRIAREGYVAPEVTCMTQLRITEASEDGDAAAMEDRCFDFVVGWRSCFVDSVRPTCLPAGWDLSRSIRKHDDLFGPGPPASQPP